MRASLRFGSVLVGLALASAACGDDTGGEGGSGSGGDTASSTSAPSTGTETGSTGTGTSASSGAGGDEPKCDFPTSIESAEHIVEFEAVLGTVLDIDGDPVGGDAVQVCGINLCLYGDTDGAGKVTVPQGGTPLDVPVFKAGDGLLRARIGYLVPEDGGEIEMTVTTIDLVDSGTTMEAGAEAEADGVVLTIADDGLVGLNTFEFDDPGEDTFRAALVPDDSIDVLAPGEDFAAVVALGPNETLFCPPAGLAIPNDADLDPGTAVEFVQQSLETGQFFGAYGKWETVAVGHVSDDGSTIETDDGEGIPILSTIGIRAD